MPPLEHLSGFNSVLAALRTRRRQLGRLYMVDAEPDRRRPRENRERDDVIRSAADMARVPVEQVSKHQLNELSQNAPHQGYVLEAGPLARTVLSALDAASDAATTAAPSSPQPLWLALDQVQDPQNLGAILRSAFFFGVNGVALCERNSAPCSPAVSRASAGALELMPIHTVSSMVTFLQQSTANGWTVVGTSAKHENTAPSHLFRYDRPVIVVLGNEGHGLRTNIARLCSAFLCIESSHQSGGYANADLVDSLNVSAATAVLCAQWRHGRAPEG